MDRIRLTVGLGALEWRPGTDPSIDITEERQRLLQQCRRLPGEPKLKLRSRVGEILVTFYNYVLHKQPGPDSDDAEESDSDSVSSIAEYEECERPTCRPIPLQYLYKIRNDDGVLEMIAREDLLDYLPRNSDSENAGEQYGVAPRSSNGNLRIMYVIIIYYVRREGNCVLI